MHGKGRSRWLPRPVPTRSQGRPSEKHTQGQCHIKAFIPPRRPHRPACQRVRRARLRSHTWILETSRDTGTTWNPGDTGEGFWGRGGKAARDKLGRGEPASLRQRDGSPHALSSRSRRPRAQHPVLPHELTPGRSVVSRRGGRGSLASQRPWAASPHLLRGAATNAGRRVVRGADEASRASRASDRSRRSF